MTIVLAVAAGLSLGLLQAVPVYAAQAAPAGHGPHSGSGVVRVIGPGGEVRVLTPDGLLRSKSVDPRTTNGCSEFKGTLYYYSTLIGGNYEQTYDVSGHVYTHCSGGGSRLYAHYTCDSFTPRGPKNADTTGTESVNWGSPECSYLMTDMYVEICWHNNAGTVHQCDDSAKL
jgi:hypothetical protein